MGLPVEGPPDERGDPQGGDGIMALAGIGGAIGGDAGDLLGSGRTTRAAWTHRRWHRCGRSSATNTGTGAGISAPHGSRWRSPSSGGAAASSGFWNRRTTEKALGAIIEEACVHGVSTRAVEVVGIESEKRCSQIRAEQPTSGACRRIEGASFASRAAPVPRGRTAVRSGKWTRSPGDGNRDSVSGLRRGDAGGPEKIRSHAPTGTSLPHGLNKSPALSGTDSPARTGDPQIHNLVL